MAYKTDIEIAQECQMKHIREIAATAHVDEKYLEQYGNYKAKIDLSLLEESDRPDGKLILVTAITPTPAGEGKTTTTIGLADGLSKIGKNVMVALREPSLGNVAAVKFYKILIESAEGVGTRALKGAHCGAQKGKSRQRLIKAPRRFPRNSLCALFNQAKITSAFLISFGFEHFGGFF